MVLFVVVTLFGLWVLQTIVITVTMPVAKQIVGDQNIALLIAKLVATGVSLVWNYVFYSRLVFKKP
jgi:putative flippase GtrA